MSVPPRARTATVVVTTHNRPDFARRAVRSALAQTMADLEVVVVDDGSDPAFSFDTHDPRVRVVRRGHSGGMCAARNDGLRVALGAWVVFLDDDDELDPTLLERALRAAEDSTLPAPVAVMTGMGFVSPDGGELEQAHPPTLRRGAHYFLAGGGDFRAKNGLVMPTDVVRAIGGWDPRLRDWDADDFGLRLNRAASIQGLDAPLYRLTQHEGSRASRQWGGIAEDMERTLAEHRSLFDQHPAAHAGYMSRIGFYHLKAGRWGPALKWSTKGLLRDPGTRRRWVHFGAALAGPHGVRALGRVRPRGITISMWTLTNRRVRKYAKRLANYPRAVLAAPVARSTQAVAARCMARSAADPPRNVLVCCVYRASNVPIVTQLLEQPLSRGWDVRLWGLDRVDPDLAAHTVGTGPGAKFPLLNALVNGAEVGRYDWVVVADDDLVFRRGSIGDLLVMAELAGLELVQPAHTELSFREHAISVRRPLAIARRTTFVEIGPVFAVRRPWISKVFPFPEEHSMGWGLELDWFDLERAGAALGIVDAVTIRHLQPVGAGYAKGEQQRRLCTLLDQRGLGSLADVQRTVSVWRPWQGAPPWTSSSRMGREARW